MTRGAFACPLTKPTITVLFRTQATSSTSISKRLVHREAALIDPTRCLIDAWYSLPTDPGGDRIQLLLPADPTPQLSKEDSLPTTNTETPVRRQDQDKINRFSRLYQRHSTLTTSLTEKQKDKEDLEEVTNELELADEDEKVPYKIGDSFVLLSVGECVGLLEERVRGIEAEVGGLESVLEGVGEEMEGLKAALYERFGRSINLES